MSPCKNDAMKQTRPASVSSAWCSRVLMLVAGSFLFAALLFGLPEMDAALLARWTFDDADSPAAFADMSGNKQHLATTQDTVPRKQGVFGNALDLQGEHALRVGAFGKPELDAITLSVWCRPTELSGYRELLRRRHGAGPRPGYRRLCGM